ncbi:hypothetical protein [Hymenobacter sp.]|uniref:hypothetical protein n=1 Tax=Hymenobacter sp. TaxID=1898978 RepID=UPI00286B366E|nr:hypothetical protein [Hymenobacter sp.]
MVSAAAPIAQVGAALPPTAAALQVATAALASARAAWLAAPFEECSTAGPWWAALEEARAAYFSAWFAHRAATRPAPAPRPTLAGTTPLGLLLAARR